MISTDVMNELTSLISKDQIEIRESDAQHHLGNDGFIVVYPNEEEQIATILKFANDNKLTINIEGMGTKRGFGGTIERADIVMSLKNYTGITEHSVGDMTMTVKAGTPFIEIQQYLSEYNQTVPLDPTDQEEATIGGIIAANDSGPKRLGYGSARDLVIGLRIAYPNGQIIRTGGKVVKNVAGYDMNKLFIGSMGTIGVITEITLKLRPLPKYESAVLLSFPHNQMEEIHRFAIKLLDSYMEPKALQLLSPVLSKRLIGKNMFSIAISFEDVESSVHYQENYMKQIQPEESELTIFSKQEAKQFWDDLANAFSRQNERTAVLKIGVKNLDVIQVIKQCQLFEEIEVEIEGHGGLGHGLCAVRIEGTDDELASFIETFRKEVEKIGGYVVLKHASLSLRKKVDVWGKKPAHFFLFDGIKTKIDPERTLNRGRFVGGI